MKHAIALTLSLLIADSCFASPPIAFSRTAKRNPPAPIDLTWSVKSLFDVENQVTVDGMMDTAKQAEQIAAQAQATQTITEILGPVVDSLARVSTLNPHLDPQTVAKSILEASVRLSAAARQLRQQFPNLYTTINFVITPWDKKNPATPGIMALNSDAFADAAFNYMNNLQFQSFGKVTEGKDPLYMLGATASIRLAAKDSEAHVQVAASLNPQYIDGTPPMEIPVPLNAAASTTILVDVHQPLDQTLPKVEIRFGKIGRLTHDNWLWRFNLLSERRTCARNDSAPNIWQKQGIWVPVPLYDVQIDLTKQEITKADARIGLLGMCWDPLSFVSGQFTQQGNQMITQMKSAVTELLGASPDDYAKIIENQRAASGISAGPEDN